MKSCDIKSVLRKCMWRLHFKLLWASCSPHGVDAAHSNLFNNKELVVVPSVTCWGANWMRYFFQSLSKAEKLALSKATCWIAMPLWPSCLRVGINLCPAAKWPGQTFHGPRAKRSLTMTVLWALPSESRNL